MPLRKAPGPDGCDQPFVTAPLRLPPQTEPNRRSAVTHFTHHRSPRSTASPDGPVRRAPRSLSRADTATDPNLDLGHRRYGSGRKRPRQDPESATRSRGAVCATPRVSVGGFGGDSVEGVDWRLARLPGW